LPVVVEAFLAADVADGGFGGGDSSKPGRHIEKLSHGVKDNDYVYLDYNQLCPH
jgi:hypothetical protein